MIMTKEKAGNILFLSINQSNDLIFEIIMTKNILFLLINQWNDFIFEMIMTKAKGERYSFSFN